MKSFSCSLFYFVVIFCGFSVEATDTPLKKIQLALNWVPEPEFGGFYAAQIEKFYEQEGLAVELRVGGAGSPTIQMVGAGKIDFAIASGGEVITARARGAKVKAVFAVYQKSPLCLMAHKSRGFKTIADIFSHPGLLAIERGQSFAAFLEKKYGFSKLKVVPYTGGVTMFLRDPNFVQQGFAFSEPILAKKQGVEPQVFFVEDSGFKNPYMEVVVVREDFLQKNTALIASLVRAIRKGWDAYLKNPEPANKFMAELNKAMDLETFKEGALAQAPLLENSTTKKHGLGWMTSERWDEQARQLQELKVVEKISKGSEYFQNF